MLERIEGIVTDIVKHNDRHNVVTLFTRRYGRMAFLAPVGKSKAGRMRNATLQLMAVVEADVNTRQGRELHTLRQPASARLWHGIYSDPVKLSLLFFLAEFSNKLLRQYPADEPLWQFLIHTLETLDALPSSRIANFHIAFLVGLLPLVGIAPPVEKWEVGDRFDMLSGEMVGSGNPEFMTRRLFITEEESRAIPHLLRMNFRNMHRFRFGGDRRQQVLDALLRYYSVHLPLGTDFKTLPILRELFA